MFDIGFYELMVVGIVALIFVGPKDLPKLFRTLVQYVGKARGMAREFQRAMNDAAKETELKDVADSINKIKDVNDNLGLNQARKAAKDYANAFASQGNPFKEPEGEDTATAEAAEPSAPGPAVSTQSAPSADVDPQKPAENTHGNP